MESREKILILMSTYNGSKYLPEQLDSIISQVGVDWTILIRDDCSKDNGMTLKILYSYKEKYPDRIEVIEGKQNVGYAKSFSLLINMGLNLKPEYNYFSFADQDDVWETDKLYIGVEQLKTKGHDIFENPILYCSNTELVRSDLSHIGYYWKNAKKIKITKERSLIQSFATGCTFVFNRPAARLYSERYLSPPYLSAHDYFMYQTCLFFGTLVFDEQSHIKYRQHNDNMIGCPTFKERMIKRIKNITNNSRLLEKQNRAFYTIYKDILSENDKKLLRNFFNYRLNFIKRLKLLINKKIQHTDFESNIIIKIKIILGRL